MGEEIASNEAGREVTIDNLFEKLGFTETQQMVDIKQQLVQAMQANDRELVVSLLNQYQDIGDSIVDSYEVGMDRIMAQLGQHLALALARRDSGRLEDYIGDLDIAWESSVLPGMEDFVPVLRAEIIRAKNELDAR